MSKYLTIKINRFGGQYNPNREKTTEVYLGQDCVIIDNIEYKFLHYDDIDYTGISLHNHGIDNIYNIIQEDKIIKIDILYQFCTADKHLYQTFTEPRTFRINEIVVNYHLLKDIPKISKTIILPEEKDLLINEKSKKILEDKFFSIISSVYVAYQNNDMENFIQYKKQYDTLKKHYDSVLKKINCLKKI